MSPTWQYNLRREESSLTGKYSPPSQSSPRIAAKPPRLMETQGYFTRAALAGANGHFLLQGYFLLSIYTKRSQQ
jgi:hypothetical protein